jgi:hypothetical protein
MPLSYFPVHDSRQVSSAFEEFQDLVESSDDAPQQQAPKPKKQQKPRSSQSQIPQLRAILARASMLMPLPYPPCQCRALPHLCLPRPMMSAIQQIIPARAELRSSSCSSESIYNLRYSSSSPTSRASHQRPEVTLRRIPCAEETMDIHIQNLHRSFENMTVATVS